MLHILNSIDDYLKSSFYIDWQSPAILKQAQQLSDTNDIETARRCFYFVRDKVHHSWDIQDRRVTARASDVLREGVGICWAKSNLLAALLRANAIPAGICYQRLAFPENPKTGFCIHALNAIYLASLDRWIRLDARGNKDGVHAAFCLEHERLAFPVDPSIGERDYPDVYAEPTPLTMAILENSTNALDMYLHTLPAHL